jgi:hypothetical protein
MTAQTFFFSHARRDTEPPGQYLTRFFQDLEERVAAWAVKIPPPYGVIDRRIPHGSDWDLHLSTALQHNNAFLAMLTPTYGTRVNCGKELGAFVLRSPSLGVDAAGQLTGVLNVLPIRWMRREAYAENNENDALIPRAMRRLEDVPAANPGDLIQAKAIEQYRRYGMESFLFKRSRPYMAILDLLAQSIVNFPVLPPGTSTASFATAIDAFRHDWSAHFKQPPPAPSMPGAQASMLRAASLRPLDTVVVFHITARAYQPSAVKCDFAANLIADPAAEPSAATDPELAALLSDVRAVAFEETMSVFNATSPADRLEADLKNLSNASVLVLVALDQATTPADAIEQVLQSTTWRGVVLRAAPPLLPSKAAEHVLPTDQQERRTLLSKVLVNLRGVLLRAGDSRTTDAETLPLLKSAD